MRSEHLLPWARMSKHTSCLAMALVLLSPMAFTDVSYAAGRIFYDGFESGNVSAWPNDNIAPDPPCTAVQTATDGIQPPKAGLWMGQCNFSDGGSNQFQALSVHTNNYADELFIRAWIRLDQQVNNNINADGTFGFKFLRFFQTAGSYHDLFEGVTPMAPGLQNQCAGGWGSCPTYWGGGGAETTHSSNIWHKIEYYIQQSTGTIKVWHDGVQVRSDSGYNFAGVKWDPFYTMSNGTLGGGHPTNHVYYDEFEIYSDNGTGATGTMSNATITQGGSTDTTPPPAPVNLRIQ